MVKINNTKQEIKKSAIKLFNDNGITNVKIRDISDHTGISIGNVTYHYSKKASIPL